MTAEEVFSDLFDKYGEDFNWYMVPLSQSEGTFVEELKKEIGESHFLYHKKSGLSQSVNQMMMCYMLQEVGREQIFTTFFI